MSLHFPGLELHAITFRAYIKQSDWIRKTLGANPVRKINQHRASHSFQGANSVAILVGEARPHPTMSSD